LVAVMIYNRPPVPVALLIRYGDSGYLVTHETPDGKLYSIVGTISEDTCPPPLGAAVNLGHSSEEVKMVKLTREGRYRIRAYSDGLGSEDQAWELLGGSTRIKELVEEA